VSRKDYVRSRDGTRIAYEATGSGPPVILVGGALDDGAENAPLAPRLSDRFTVYNYARRGRGASGDTPPYTLKRELEDLSALLASAGGHAHLFGASSGGALALEAAMAGVPVDRVAVYEVPYFVTGPELERWQAYVRDLAAILADDRRDDALALFMRLAGSSEEDIERARGTQPWAASAALSHTLAHDAACLGDGHPPARLAKLPNRTLILTGDHPFFHPAADTLAVTIPAAERKVLSGQDHVADPAVLAPTLADFFA
jgi:hypothetical protein